MHPNQATQEIQNNIDRSRSNAAPESRTSRIQRFASNLSLKAVAESHAQVLNETLRRWIELAWDGEETGSLHNMDRVTGRFYIAVPTGRQYKAYGITKTESDALRLYLRRWQERPSVTPMLQFNDVTRQWHLNIVAYRSKKTCMQVLTEYRLTSANWDNLIEQVRAARRRHQTQK